jgi:MscS family membrane protein
MPLLRENRQDTSKSLKSIPALCTALAIFLFVSPSARCPAQLPNFAAPPPSNTEPPAVVDPLGRETPRGTMLGLLKYGGREDFATAARYLQLAPGQDTDLVQRAKEFQALHTRLNSNVGLLSDDPNGTVEPGLPPGEVRAGVLEVGSTTADVILVQVDDPSSGKIWLVSKETVANIPKLYTQMEREGQTRTNRILPAPLTSRLLLGMSLAQWLGWLVSVPTSWFLAWLFGVLLGAPRRGWYKLRNLPFTTIWETPLGMPLRCSIAVLMHSLFVYLLEPPLLYRVYYFRFMAVLLVGSLAWLVSRIADRGFHHAVQHTRAHNGGGESILILMQRLTHITIGIFVVLAALALFGLNVKTALAGLGIGGLAIALAAQKSLENLIAGVSLLMDKAVEVGDPCRIGDRLGTVEDIGLRSLKMRTLDQNLLVVPNGALAQMQFENMRARTKLLINQNFSLRIETQAEQLRFVLNRVKSMLDEHPAIESGSSRVRVIGFAGSAFEVELFAFGKTGDWTEFTAIRQDVILKLTEIVEAAGTRFAAPTRLAYLSRDAGLDEEKGNDVVRHVTELRANGAFRFPGEVPHSLQDIGVNLPPKK